MVDYPLNIYSCAVIRSSKKALYIIMLSQIGERIANLSINGYLDLSNLSITEIPELPKDIYSIKYLFLNDNKLKNIDVSLFANLLVLDVSDNPIETIDFLPEKLEEFVCKSCKIKYIVSHKNIKKLQCSDNLLEELGEYTSLMDLECENNKIKIINSYTCLEELVCNNNPLNEIKSQPNLKHIDCSNTNISSIDANKLETIHFPNTNIKKLHYIKTLKYIVFNDQNIELAADYKLESCVEYDGNIDILLERRS
jgi:hypothetical protein